MILGLYCNKRNPIPEPFPPGTWVPLLWYKESQSSTVEYLPLIPDDGSIPPADPPYIFRFDNSTATEKNTKTLNNICTPVPLLPLQHTTTTSAFQIYFNIDPRPQRKSMDSSIRGKYQVRPTTPTDSSSKMVIAPPQNYGGSLYTNSINTRTILWWNKNSSPATI